MLDQNPYFKKVYLNSEEPVLQRVDDDEHVAELCGEDAAAVVPPVLAPHDVDLVVADVPKVKGVFRLFTPC